MKMKIRIPRLVCAECGHPFDRGDTGRNHIKNKHQGQGNVVSFMAYVIGVLKGSLPYPSYNMQSTLGPKSRRTQNSSSRFTVNPFEPLHQIVQFMRDMKDVNELTSYFTPQNVSVEVQSPAKEYLFGEACSSCLIIFRNFVSPFERPDFHQCEPKPPDFRTREERLNETLMIYSQLPVSLKRLLDDWIPGQKYLQAFCISEGGEQYYPSYIKRVKHQIERNAAGNDYISRAIALSIDPVNLWTPFSDEEVLDFLAKAHASVLLVETEGSHCAWYEVRIVPPHYVSAKMDEERNKPLKELLSQMQEQMRQQMQRMIKEQREQIGRMAKEYNQENS